MGSDYGAMAINSTTGAADAAGDIRFEQSLGAVGKTIGAAVGLTDDVLGDQITTGKVVQAALTP
jgi:hypothetical protein